MAIAHSAEQLRRELLQRRSNLEAELQRVETALAALNGLQGVGDIHLDGDDWSSLGMIEAARKLLEESGQPMSTRSLVEEMLRRGVRTRSKKPIATLYVVLREAPGFAFDRARRAWTLATGKAGRSEVTAVTVAEDALPGEHHRASSGVRRRSYRTSSG
ncbi:HTH domain-containing protein [Luteitalea sp. TBR-22]|uniref:HTH domain-containing protein n=1 Tax=Luteitalea sp. TBR-22 TaxID=2802971 RepID=UPI001EF50939|nr:HTH domain-containing protein [Luteitalea sp. TBR-22]